MECIQSTKQLVLGCSSGGTVQLEELRSADEVGATKLDLSPREEAEIKEKAIIYRKESKRPLSQYHHRMNAAAQEICLKNPSMLTKRGELQLAAQDAVVRSGYQFKKGHSRSKKLVGEPQLKRPKMDKDLRTQRIQELKEDIKDCNDRILFKEKRCEAASAVKNYKLCDNLSEEIVALKSRRREFEAELKVFECKEQKSKWYHKKKSHSSVAHSSESESDSFSHPTTPMSRSRSSTPMVSSDSEHSICCVSLSSVLGSSSVSSKGTDCREFSPPCGSPLFSPVITAKSGVHQGGGFSQELLPHPTSGHDPQRPLSPSSRGSMMVISSDSEVPTSPSAPDYPPLKRSFAIHPGVSSVDSDSELQSSSNLPSSDLVQSFLEGFPVTTLNRAPQGGQ